MRKTWILLLIALLVMPFAAVAQDDEEMSQEDLDYALVDAVYEEDAREVRNQLEAGASADAMTESGLPIIGYAAMKGYEDIVDALVAAGADVNAQDRTGATALMYAAQFDHDDVVTALIEAGADINATDNLGWTPVIRAVVGGNIEAVQALKDAGADLNATDFFGRNAVQVAEGRDLDEIIELLRS